MSVNYTRSTNIMSGDVCLRIVLLSIEDESYQWLMKVRGTHSRSLGIE